MSRPRRRAVGEPFPSEGLDRTRAERFAPLLHPSAHPLAVNPTAVLHVSAAVLVGAGFLLSGQLLTLGLIGLGVVLFVAGIVVARRDDGTASEA